MCTFISLIQFQHAQIDKYCRKHGLTETLYTLPQNKTQKELLYRHLIFDDRRKSLFCFVEKIGCTDMKRLLFVTSGVLPLETIHHSWVDLRYLERGLRRGSLLNKNLTDASRLLRMKNYFKFMIVRNPLERLVSGYRNKIEPPLMDLSDKFPNYIKRWILKTYRPVDYRQWIDQGGNYNISISFPEFAQYVIDTKKEWLNPHFKPMINTCHPCRVRYDFYGNFKMYSQDVMLIVEKIRTKPEYYPNHSLHRSGHETSTYLGVYYNQLTHAQKTELYYSLEEELEFYYYLYPAEKDSHVDLLGVHRPVLLE